MLTYKSKDDITNGFDIGNVETKEAILALCIEYQKEVKQFDINEQWLRTNISGYLESQTSEPIIPQYHWAYEALAKICGHLDFDSQSWLPIELYGEKKARPIFLTRREVVLLLHRILSESKVASGFNARTFKVQQIHEAEVIEYIAALRTEFADELASLGVRFR